MERFDYRAVDRLYSCTCKYDWWPYSSKKLATLCEAFGIRTAWHGPNDITPVGVAAQLHLDLSSPNFGVQEFFLDSVM